MISCLIYGILGLHGSALDEVLPLYLLNPIKHGGFEYNSSQIGFIYMLSAPIQLFGLYIFFITNSNFNNKIFFYPLWTEWFGYRKGMIIGCIIESALTYYFPILSITNKSKFIIKTILLCIIYGIVQMFRVMCFTSVIVLINNSCYPEQRSKANAIGQTINGISRAFGPYIGAYIFAWSENNFYGYPFNYTFLFRVYYLLKK